VKRKDLSHLKRKSLSTVNSKVALANCGFINPESMEEYIATGGYEALGTV
jgi:NADP-reducing hydrogenase subunit HndC